MGNGSIKAPRPEDSFLASSLKVCDTKPLRLRIAHLEEELAQRDQELKSQELQLQSLQRELEAKVSQIEKLQDAIGYNSLGRSPLTPNCHRLLSVINQGPTRFHRVAVEVHRRLKAKEGVSAEPTSGHFCGGFRVHHVSIERARVRKDSSTKKLINDAIMNNDFLKKLDPQHMREMVDCMYERIYTEGQLVIQEGEPGNFLYVLADGLLEVMQNGKLLGEMRPRTAFGELAILYNCKRTATVKAVSQAHIWALDRQTFQSIMMKSTQATQEEYFSFLRSVSLLRDLPEEKLAKIVDCLEIDYFDKGEYIIREGEEGNTFFIIAKGEVRERTQISLFIFVAEKSHIPLWHYREVKADVRSANIISTENDTQCLVVDRDNFNQMVGTYEELQAYLKEYVEELSRCDERRNFSAANDWNELQKSLKLETYISLTNFKAEDTTFALKCIKKKHIVDTRQQEHIYSEKNILQQTNSHFIVRLFRTFRDDKYVYMLLEACLGGELWSVLRDMSSFEEQTARFCIACVLEAFDYLHARGIIYRDLKPENLLLDAEGYVKMADFGFAKRIGLGKKTWTFCGTPEYVAPEVIMNKGHDFGADCWSLGILIFELLTGSPPFSGTDPIKIYTMVLHGIEKVDFPKRISKRPDDLIRRLCKYVVVALQTAALLANRILKMNSCLFVTSCRWFQGFNWEGLRRQKLISPLKRELKGPMDHSHFDIFPPELEETPDELSGWDKDF
uniref:cGMP-dependent protein kinase n=1 Tax=Oncorhynchus kisutch TaxID=8019 RepID=A0A8C7DKT3_ONCKI